MHHWQTAHDSSKLFKKPSMHLVYTLAAPRMSTCGKQLGGPHGGWCLSTFPATLSRGMNICRSVSVETADSSDASIPLSRIILGGDWDLIWLVWLATCSVHTDWHPSATSHLWAIPYPKTSNPWCAHHAGTGISLYYVEWRWIWSLL